MHPCEPQCTIQKIANIVMEQILRIKEERKGYIIWSSKCMELFPRRGCKDNAATQDLRWENSMNKTDEQCESSLKEHIYS